MIFDELDILPIKLYYKVCKTGNINLLSTEPTEVDLLEIWQKMQDEFDELNADDQDKRHKVIEKQINSHSLASEICRLACVSLEFEFNQDLIDMLLGLKFNVDTTSNETYYESIKKCRRQIETNKIKISALKNQLPKENSDGNKVSLDNIMASYCAILNIDFDYNLCTVTKFFALKKQVDLKIKSYEKMTENIK